MIHFSRYRADCTKVDKLKSCVCVTEQTLALDIRMTLPYLHAPAPIALT